VNFTFKVAATKSLRVRIPLLCRGNEMITEPHAAGADSYIGEVAPVTGGGGATPPSDPACRSALYGKSLNEKEQAAGGWLCGPRPSVMRRGRAYLPLSERLPSKNIAGCMESCMGECVK
jgi:hypothetical protein